MVWKVKYKFRSRMTSEWMEATPHLLIADTIEKAEELGLEYADIMTSGEYRDLRVAKLDDEREEGNCGGNKAQ